MLYTTAVPKLPRRVCCFIHRLQHGAEPQAASQATVPTFTTTIPKGSPMLSARNQLKGTIKELKLDNVMAEVVVSLGGVEIAAAITHASAQRLGLKRGDTVTAVIKATDVMIDK